MPEASPTPDQSTIGLRNFIDRAKVIRVKRNRGNKDAVLRAARDLESEGKEKAEVRAETAENKAAIDNLTGLLNSDTYYPERKRILETISRDENMPTSQGIRIDLDEFRIFNKIYGNQVGNQALKQIGHVIRTNTRISDTSGRIGGDELEITATRTKNPNRISNKLVIPLSEKIRSSIESTTFGPNLKITASIGVTEFQRGENIKDYDNRLENAQVTAKRLGKNRVVEARFIIDKFIYIDHSTGMQYKVDRDNDGKILDPVEIK